MNRLSLEDEIAKIVQTDSPKTFPLDELEDALVEIEYSDNKSKVKRKFVPVGNLVPRGSKTYADHVIYSGKLKGTLVRHMRTEGIFLKVMPKGRKKKYSCQQRCCMSVGTSGAVM